MSNVTDCGGKKKPAPPKLIPPKKPRKKPLKKPKD